MWRPFSNGVMTSSLSRRHGTFFHMKTKFETINNTCKYIQCMVRSLHVC